LAKQAIKAWYRVGHLAEDDYLMLLAAVDARHNLSHIYDNREFNEIVARLPGYAQLLQRVLRSLIAV
jgi:hypothetical protein